ncbi:MAG: LuxR C-terminal-related transcriptional regulator [Sulfitobacter sp.]
MLIKHAAELEKKDDVDALWQGVVDTLACAGFDHAIYLTVNADFEHPFLRCTVEGLYNLTPPPEDPFLRYACSSYGIVQIGSEFVDSHPYITDAERAFVERAGARGFRSGFGIPMRLQGSQRFGGFIVGTGLDRATFSARISPRAEEMRLFCLIIHRRIEELTGPVPTEPQQDFRAPLMAPVLPPLFDTLSPREREIIYLLAQGRSRKETAEICGISVHTVSDYAKSSFRKLNIHNRAQAAALIYDAGHTLDE